MAEFLSMIILLIAVAMGAFHLGRLQQQDRIEFLLDELDVANSVVHDLMNMRRANMARHLQAVKDHQQ